MQDELIQLLAGRRGHFQMESGCHSEWWFQLDRLFDSPARLRPFVAELARRLAAHRPEAVCGPMTGGAKLAEMVAAELGVGYFFTERFEQPGAGATGLFPVKYRLPSPRRDAVRGKAIAIVDDAVSAGSAARGTHADLLACGAAARFAAEQHLALEGIAQMPFGLWLPVECPLCQAGVPVEKVSDAA